MVYTIENNYSDDYPYSHTYTIFGTNDLEKAKKKFSECREKCSLTQGKGTDEYILYQWEDENSKIIDRCDNYDEEL